MAFVLQLKLLLWKNFTLKRRKPITLLFEIFIPLALFLIIVAIRRTQPVKENAAEHFPIWPLPSAGLFAVIQSFCDQSLQNDEYGFPVYENATTTEFLSQLNVVAENNNFFRPGFTLVELNEVPKIYRSIVDDPLLLKKVFEDRSNSKESYLKDLLIDPNATMAYLSKNLSFDAEALETVIHVAQIDRVELYSVFFRNPSISKVFSLDKSSASEDKHSKDAIVGHQLGGMFFNMLKNNGNISHNWTHLYDHELLLDLLKDFVFEEDRVTESFCTHPLKIRWWNCSRDLTKDCERKFAKLSNHFCLLQQDKKLAMLSFMKKQITTAKLMPNANINNSTRDKTIAAGHDRLHTFFRNITVFINFKKALRNLRKIADTLPHDSCVNDSSSSSTDVEDSLRSSAIGTEIIRGISNGNASKFQNTTTANITKPHQFYRLWKAMHKTACGTELKFKEARPESLNDLELSNFQMDKIKLLIHVLYNNPKILYVPSGTEADKIIQKANQTFVLFDQVNKYVAGLQIVGDEIKDFLAQETTIKNLKIMRKIQTDIKNSPFGQLLAQVPIVQEFISDIDITDDKTFSEELTVMSSAACSWNRSMAGLTFNLFQGFSTEDDMLNYFKTKAYLNNETVIAGVVFHMNDDGSLPNHMIYKIRQNASFTKGTDRMKSRFWFPGPGDLSYSYYRFGFVWIQEILERSMIDLYAERDVNEPGAFAQNFPYPCYISDNFLFMIQHVMPLSLTISWVYSVAMLVQYIVYEKEQRLKEMMKMMGMKNYVHWIAWFISSFTQLTITVVMLTFILKYGKVLSYSDIWITFLTMEIFAVSLIMFSFLVSVLFSKAKIAAACAGIIYFMSYVPYMYIAVREEGAQEIVSPWLKAFASLLAPTAFGLGAKYFAFYEEIGVGIQWGNIDSSPAEDDGFSLFAVIIMLIFDTFLYLVLFWYIENVCPGTFGLPKPWYFPFQKSYWFGDDLDEPVLNSSTGDGKRWWNKSLFPLLGRKGLAMEGNNLYSAAESFEERTELFENEPDNIELGVSINNLCKRYKDSSKYAVKHLNLKLYQGQVTALLGPVGSGKSTTMSILTGLFPPTSGTASIYGHDIKTNMDQIRNSLGICTQHNTLFDDLTVEEHIWFYSKLRGQKNDEEEIDRLIEDVDLPEKRHQQVFCLSGGMKRKLSVAIAFVGGSRAVFVDEPTAGVDPAARRSIWDLIIKHKAGRTILLSTHHMEEADILGDKLAIIENGRIKCCGSSLYLRNLFGDGYHLSIEKQEQTRETRPGIYRCTQEEVTSNLRVLAPKTKFMNETKHELHYLLSMQDLRAGNFVKVFQMLASSKSSLGISSYGVKNTTLEEVFMKAIADKDNRNLSYADSESEKSESNVAINLIPNATDANQEAILPIWTDVNKNPSVVSSGELPPNEPNTAAQSVSEGIPYNAENVDPKSPTTVNMLPNPAPDMLTSQEIVTGKALVYQQFTTILWKRYLCTRRNIEGLFSQVLLPAFFVSVAMSVALTAPELKDLPELILSPSQFHDKSKYHTNVFVYSNNGLDISTDRSSEDANSEGIVDAFTLASGIGASCILRTPYNDSLRSDGYLYRHDFDSLCEDTFISHVPSTNKEARKNAINYGNRERMYPICYCAEHKTSFTCPKYGFHDPPSFKVVSGDLIIDISGQNESLYYLYTTDKFKQQRYGGISVGLLRNSTPVDFGASAPSMFRRIAVRHVSKVWYNSKGFHAFPTYLNVLNNAILRANIPSHKGNPAGFGITVINHPFPNTHHEFYHDEILQGNEVLIAIFIIVAMSFVPASFVLFVVYERYNKAKHLQLISGVNPVVYLMANYIWDICNYMVPAAFIITILLIFDLPAYTSASNFPATVTLFLMYGWCISPVMHCVSYLFKEPSSAYIFLIVINLFVGITCIVTSFLLEVFSSDPFLVKTHGSLKMIFMMFPNYCLGRGLMDLAFNDYYGQFLIKTGQYNKVLSPFKWEIIGRNLFAMATTGLSFIVITVLLEMQFCHKSRRMPNLGKSPTTLIPDEGDEDEDVSNERNRTNLSPHNEDILTVKDMSKVYYTKKLGSHLAVNQLTFGVPIGECMRYIGIGFGLLGVNGAGKSTTFKMLTGDSRITAGDAFVNGRSVKHDKGSALSSVGYCPQFDALYDELSAREHLNLYAALRGIPTKRRPEIVDKILNRLDLMAYADRPCGTYSGGNRRKISAAIALVGSPSLIFLDEPTSGQDPRSRRFLWDLMLSLVKEGKSIVFTSHTMEECEVLCTRLAIMVNGKFKCLGSIQHLKNKFGNGYSICVRCHKDKDVIAKVEKYFKKSFSQAILKEKHYNSLRYEVSSEFVLLEDIFDKMEHALSGISIIEDYSVSQNTLDNVFINFAKHQKEIQLNLNICKKCDSEKLPTNSTMDIRALSYTTVADTMNANTTAETVTKL